MCLNIYLDTLIVQRVLFNKNLNLDKPLSKKTTHLRHNFLQYLLAPAKKQYTKPQSSNK